jgi:hypothetical protein
VRSHLDQELNAASIPTPPTGEFNALTFVGAQVKDESMPRRAWELRPGTVPPTPPVSLSPPLCDAVRHGRRQSRETVPPTPIRLTRRALERGRRSPRRGNRRLLYAHTGLHRDVRIAGLVTSIAVYPVLCALRSPISHTLEPASRRRPNEKPLRRHPRSRYWTDTGHTMMSC